MLKHVPWDGRGNEPNYCELHGDFCLIVPAYRPDPPKWAEWMLRCPCCGEALVAEVRPAASVRLRSALASEPLSPE